MLISLSVTPGPYFLARAGQALCTRAAAGAAARIERRVRCFMGCLLVRRLWEPVATREADDGEPAPSGSARARLYRIEDSGAGLTGRAGRARIASADCTAD